MPKNFLLSLCLFAVVCVWGYADDLAATPGEPEADVRLFRVNYEEAVSYDVARRLSLTVLGGINFPYGSVDFDNHFGNEPSSFHSDDAEQKLSAAFEVSLKLNFLSWLAFGVAIEYADVEIADLKFDGDIAGIITFDGKTDFVVGHTVSVLPIFEFRTPPDWWDRFALFAYFGIGGCVDSLKLSKNFENNGALALFPQRLKVEASFGAIFGAGIDFFLVPAMAVRLELVWLYHKVDFQTTNEEQKVLSGEMDLSALRALAGVTFYL